MIPQVQIKTTSMSTSSVSITASPPPPQPSCDVRYKVVFSDSGAPPSVYPVMGRLLWNRLA